MYIFLTPYSEENKINEQLRQLNAVTESEYDRMSSDEQHAFEENRRALKHLKKDIQEKRKRELKEFASTQKKREEQKAEEERLNLRKGTAPTKKRANKNAAAVAAAQVCLRIVELYWKHLHNCEIVYVVFLRG
jgi:hypothetical protein